MFRQISRTLSLLLVLGAALPSRSLIAEDDLATKLRKAEVVKFVQSPAYGDAPAYCNGAMHFSGNGYWRIQTARPEKVFEFSPSGAAVRNERDLLLCGSGLNALLNLSPDGKVHVLADEFEGKRLNSLDDLTIDAQGRIYWTDPVGSSLEQPTGKVFRLAPDGTVSLVIEHLAFPSGIEVDPSGKSLIVVESQSYRILKFDFPENDAPFGEPKILHDLAGTGGDGCAFDRQGNLWVADFHRKVTGQGRVTVISPDGELIGHVGIPAKVVSNLAFGGVNFDEVYCTTAEPPALFQIRVGTVGFSGHQAPKVTFRKELDVTTISNSHPFRPRKLSRFERRRQKMGNPEIKSEQPDPNSSLKPRGE